MRILPGFIVYNVAAVLSDLFSTVLNIALIYALFKYASHLDKKTVRFAIAFSVLSIIFAVSQALVQPFEVIFDGVGISFAVSFLHDSPVAEHITHFVMAPCYMALLECGAFNFLYKYAATCSKTLYNRFFDPCFMGCLSTVAAIWLLIHTFSTAYFKPSQAFREKVALALNKRFNTDFRDPRVYFGGIDIEDSGEQAQGLGTVIATINFMSLVSCCLGTMMWCGWRIQRMIASNKISERTRKVHRQALRLLVLQTFNPLFFAVFPLFIPVIIIQTRITLPEAFSWFNAYGLLFFPLLNPIIFVICIKDFRNSMITRLQCGTRRAAQSHTMSISRRSTA